MTGFYSTFDTNQLFIIMIRNALIAGATGLVGKELVSLLIKSGYYNSLHMATRKPYTWHHQKITSHTLSFDDFESLETGAIVQDVYICLGTTMKKAGSKDNFRKVDYEYVLNVAKWAKNHKAEKLAVISSVGAKADSGNFYLRTKGEMEKALTGLKLPHLIIFRPSLLLGIREEFRLTEKLSAAIISPFAGLMRKKLKKYAPVEASQVARAMFHLTINATKPVKIAENADIIGL